MLFMKKLFLGLTALALIFIGGSGTQSSNLLMQGGGFVGIIVGFVVLYLFGKIVWRAMGCLPSLLIICGVIGFVLFAIGAFNDGGGNILTNIQSFLGQNKHSQGFSQQQGSALQLNDDDTGVPSISENFGDMVVQPSQPAAPSYQAQAVVPEGCPPSNCPPEETPQQMPQPVMAPQLQQQMQQQAAQQAAQQQPVQQPQAPQQEESGLMKLVNSLTGGGKQANLQASGGFNPNNYPAVSGVAKVINGDTIELRGRYLKLFGVAAPISNQTCADSRGRSYACGQEAARWLKSWISGHELECRVVQQDGRGNMVGTCAFGQYDIGAALVNAGWAVANIKVTDIYVPYEMQAQQNLRGLWQGQFYMPWDWKEIQSKKPKIKVIQPKRPKKSILDF